MGLAMTLGEAMTNFGGQAATATIQKEAKTLCKAVIQLSPFHPKTGLLLHEKAVL